MRPRFSRRVAYDPQQKEKEQLKIRLLTELQSLHKEALDFAVDTEKYTAYSLRLVFYLPIPESWPTKKKNLYEWNAVPAAVKPDSDNLEKWILDGANKILYPDDCKIVSLSSEKYYSWNPRTVLMLSPIANPLQERTSAILSAFSYGDMLSLFHDVDQLKSLMPEHECDYEDRNDRYARLNLAAERLYLMAYRYGKALNQISKIKPLEAE